MSNKKDLSSPFSRKMGVEKGMEKFGLYNARYEHDACGVGFIASLKGQASHDIITDGLEILVNLTHRGAVGADPLVGDGAGMLIQIPHALFLSEQDGLGFDLPDANEYGVAMVFLPQDETMRRHCMEIVEQAIAGEGLELLGIRDVPVNNHGLSPLVMDTEPVHKQLFIGKRGQNFSEEDFERKLYIARKVLSNRIHAETRARESGFYIVSMSACTIVYKGMFLANQLGPYYKDLSNPNCKSALAILHQRFSTNTFPSWKLAHPYRMVAHNGEINTIRGNVNWMAARQASAHSKKFGENISKLWPISYEGQSDTACFDNALEFLCMGGYSLPHAMMMLIPEAWGGNELMDAERHAFYEYHAALMEPWDGPVAVAFTNGRQIGATLDRNGLRPARYIVTHDRVIMASEAGVLPVKEEEIVAKWRLQPGKMLLLDMEQGKIITDDEIKQQLAGAHPYQNWLDNTQIILEEMSPIDYEEPDMQASLLDRQQAFGYSQEDIKLLMSPMAVTGQEAVGAMGTDTPLSVLSRQPKLLYSYFKQNFAQVTNPPIDPIREELVMSLVSFIGPRPNLFDLDGDNSARRLEVRQPVLSNRDLEKIRAIATIPDNHFRTQTLEFTYPVHNGVQGMEKALTALSEASEQAVKEGYNIIILSDRKMDAEHIAIPALLAVAAVHHHLIRKGLRTSVGLVVETGEAREIHHFCLLGGYGAEAINPYLAFETLADLHARGAFPQEVDAKKLVRRYTKSVNKGILKVMSKMGISTWQSYCGAQIFDAIGLSQEFIEAFFFGTSTAISGAGLAEIADETVERHARAFSQNMILADNLDIGGEYALRQRGEVHAWSPDAIARLQHAARSNDFATYGQFSKMMNDAQKHHTIRGLLRIRKASEMGQTSIAVDEVEAVKEIVKRFATGAMSFGSISREAHSALAVAMNQMAGKSNTGEGGEEPERFHPFSDGSPNPQRSAIKQVASGRFGVTTEYLVNSDMIQIKVAQGAKPGEGGQLPGHKVNAVIAKVRHSTPGVGLISPPPHHDIYSIEDLAQLIFDLKNVNPKADISVKLVSEAGVGTVAAGVAKARADHITISGYDGGTGASPLTSIKHAGSPWEIGLAETQQTLVLNGLRSRVVLQTDGGLRTGRDVIIAALLGADEFGFSTAPLIAAGCIMMRKCHLNTCPVGIATQDPELRKRFRGTPEHVINYFFFVAEEVRTLMAEMGVRCLDELIGQTQWLQQDEIGDNPKAARLDLSPLLAKSDVPLQEMRHSIAQKHPIDDILDRQLVKAAKAALENKTHTRIDLPISNNNRSTGALLAGEIAAKYGSRGLPDDSISINLSGSAGQSFGAFAMKGMTLRLTGDANDYVGKGLSGGKIIIHPPANSAIVAEKSIIVGNTVLYGAISGECYFSGVAGERFAVRNSGAFAVVEGVGDHGCEYMTGGIVVVLGRTGRNFAAGMSGGVAYVFDEDGSFATCCNQEMVEITPVPAEEAHMELYHHQLGDIEHKGRVELSADMTRFDAERLFQLITSHQQMTGSPKAGYILENWEKAREKFVKVMPIEYQRALNEMAEALNINRPSGILKESAE